MRTGEEASEVCVVWACVIENQELVFWDVLDEPFRGRGKSPLGFLSAKSILFRFVRPVSFLLVKKKPSLGTTGDFVVHRDKALFELLTRPPVHPCHELQSKSDLSS